MRYLSAHYVFPVSSPPLRNGIVCVNDDGSIDKVIDTGGKLEEREKTEFYNGILVPGFVNAHCHLELSHLRGTIEPHGGLPDFISSIGRIRGASNETILSAAETADEEMTRNGIVAVGDISNNSGTVNIKQNSRIWYRTFIELFGLDGSRSKDIHTHAEQVQQEYHNAGLPASVVPHAIYSVSQALWDVLCKSYAAQIPPVISIHHQESSEEMDTYLEGKGELAGMFRKNGLQIGDVSKDTLSLMKRCFCEASKCLLVHNTFSSKDDLSAYISVPEKFYFVLCPGSNLFLQNRLPDLYLFSSQELSRNTCLGTDSLASNTSLSILGEMKIIQQYAPDIPLGRLMQWATLNGAMALECNDLYGSFEKGKIPGINLITGIDFERMQLTTESAVKVIYN